MVVRVMLLSLLMSGCTNAVVAGGPFPGDPKNFSYELGGTKVELKDGRHEVKTGSGVDDFLATDLTEARLDADFDGDDSTDCAVVITHDQDKTKVHYLAILLNKPLGISAITYELGRNVLVQNLAPHPKGGLLVKMLGRDEGAPEDVPPALPIEKRLAVKDGAIVPAK